MGVAVESLSVGSENLVVADTVLRDRVVYQRSHMLGQTVVEYLPRDERGIEEMLSLYKEVYCEDYPAKSCRRDREMAHVSGGVR